MRNWNASSEASPDELTAAATRLALPMATPRALILPCTSCRKHAHIEYVQTVFPEENGWTCPSCGTSNRLRLKGKVTAVTMQTL